MRFGCLWLAFLLSAPAIGDGDGRWLGRDDGTAGDEEAGLIWKRCSEGQQWREDSCTGDALGHDHEEALLVASASRFAGHEDWRLPTLAELRRLRIADAPPLIDSDAFPATPAISYWSASAVAHGTDGAFVVHFSAGPAAYGVAVPNERHGVRLVRSAGASSDRLVPQR